MSRWYMNDEEKRGYDDRLNEGRYASEPWSRSHDYRQGWKAAQSDICAEERREEERRELEQAEEQAAERRAHEAQQARLAEENAYYEQCRDEDAAMGDAAIKESK